MSIQLPVNEQLKTVVIGMNQIIYTDGSGLPTPTRWLLITYVISRRLTSSGHSTVLDV